MVFSTSVDAFFSEDGQTVLTIAGDSPARVWRTNSDSEKPALELGEAAPFGFAAKVYLTPRRDQVLIGYYSSSGYRRPRCSYRIFSLTDGKLLVKEIQLRLDQILLDVSPNLDRIIVGEGVTALVRSASDFHSIGQLVRHKDRIARAIFRKDGRSFCTVSRDGSLRIWDASTGFALSDPLIFNRHPPSFGGPASDDDYFANLPQPTFPSGGRRVSFREPEYQIGDSTFSPLTLTWDISVELTGDEAKQLNELVTLVYGVRLGDSGAFEFVPQSSVPELKERFQQYEGSNSVLGRLIKSLFTPREAKR
jgi:WD40 repeat protein